MAIGGNGEKVTQTISVTAGQVITVTVGKGGSAGASGIVFASSYYTKGTAGGSSSFGTVTARGGGGAPALAAGTGSPSYSGGAGGNTKIAGRDGWVKINYNQTNDKLFMKVVK